ncbi:TIGR04086 family membrane protein [Cohnella caldifontis]|uniref:TIGR04086 family membrane protein n=1 Tax=Cohnella caldifontis TaxID=3027471 RepID=UPI0023ED2835|nr:TIGR04086 family membrane protein [Cohnella sp. YIM B05605]
MNPISRVAKVRVSSPLLSGLIWSCIWLGAGALLLSVLLAQSSVREDQLLPWVFGIHGAASLAGGFVSARRSGQKGWYHGALNGAVYTSAVVVTSFLAADTEWSLRIAAMLGVTIVTGAFGGMLGVNSGTTPRGRA